ncbi:MAG: PKD domain-containing protein [Candidatus Zixiibacteriota bacterium]
MKNLAIFLAMILLFSGYLFAAPDIKHVDSPPSIPSFVGWVPDQIVVQLKETKTDVTLQATSEGFVGTGIESLDALANKYEVTKMQKQFVGAKPVVKNGKTFDLSRYFIVEFDPHADIDEVVEAYKNDLNVESVEKIGLHTMYATPNDGYYSYQWHLEQTNDHDVDAAAAWDLETGSTSIIIADLDSGTRYYHPDLGGANASVSNPGASRGNMWINTAELNGTSGVDDDGNGYTDDWIGWDFIDGVSSCWTGEDCTTQDNDPRDFNGHGTHTAGIIGMITNDGYGMAGVAGGWGSGSQAEYGNGVKVMALRMGYSYNYGGTEYGVVNMAAAASAFYYAANNGAKIATCSWGSSNSGGIGAAIDYFLANGGMVFVAAGNDGSQTADYMNGRGDLVSVAATDENDGACSFTTYGTWVDICAPGNNIYSTYHDHTDASTIYWAALSGTSMATPLTAGVAGLIWSHNPTWTASQVASQLYSSADNIDAYLTSTYIGKMGAGRVNAYNAVNTGTPDPPVAAFTGTPTSGTAPLTVSFTDQSTGSITSWSWTFGDGGTSTSQSPSHQYTSAGTYSVTLTVTGPGGSDGETKTNYITVSPCVAPTAAFSGTPTSGDYPLAVAFTNSSTGATSYSWNFGDGGTSTQTNPSHTYTAAGTYTVTLTATNACGSDDEVKTGYITVTTPPCYAPVADFSGTPTSGTYPMAVSFTDLSTNSPTSWSWNFGDGGTSTAQNPSHTYTAAGTYTVSLTATNSCGSDGETKTAYISVDEPSTDYATLPYSTGFETGSFDSYWFTQSSNSNGRIQITTANTPRGSYHMTMDVISNGTYSQNEAWLRLNLAGKSDVELSFYWKEFSDEDHTQDGVFLSSNGGSTFTKVYNLTGGSTTYQQIVLDIDALAAANGLSLTSTFVVKFQQYDNYAITTDGMAFDDISVISYDIPPVADFTANVTSGYAPLAVTFTDQSLYNPTSWSWTFGDGGTSTAQNPSHTYTAAGTYTVTLTATNAFGSDLETKTGYITVSEATGWMTITYDDFESGFGNYTDGGGDCALYIYGTYAWEGNNAADIQDNSGTASSFYHTVGYNVSAYSEMEVDFYFVAISMESGEDFWVQYYNGSTWQTVASFAQGVDFSNNTFYHAVVTISSGSYNFPTNARLRFMCDASGNADDVYIDNIEWRGQGGTSSLNALASNPGIPDKFALNQNYPNPFNPVTTIKFSVPAATDVSIDVFNILGQRVATVAEGFYEPGEYKVTWDGAAQASGVYFYRIQAGQFTETKKMVLLK